MPDDLNSVNMESGGARSYHHGALREALIAAAEDLIAERGVDAFSLRETARRAGVSPAAPAHHFDGARGLLTAVAAGAYRDFGDALAAADDSASSRTARIRAQGMAYVRFALANPARFDLMWRRGLIDGGVPDLKVAADRAFLILDRAARGAGEAMHGSDDVQRAPSIAAWSLVHGFARLALEGAFGGEPGAAERAAETMLPRVLDHLDL
ncbi:TetR/AcrR family transcriptional regulator [Sphingosinicella sp.]|uniref:TetR/AcrR family transcriptional regulator n=1 Tax=Sphingosinicella sp. TaxID=1917971 RepID=UPI004037AF65